MTYAGTRSPRSTAFLANRPAPIMTEGLEVFVQLVIAAMTTDPWVTEVASPRASTGTR